VTGTTEPAASRAVVEREAWRRRSRTRRRVLTGIVVLVAFGLGVALGQALHDNPRAGGSQTRFLTIPPRSTAP
jgi:hypothetical protein